MAGEEAPHLGTVAAHQGDLPAVVLDYRPDVQGSWSGKRHGGELLEVGGYCRELFGGEIDGLPFEVEADLT